MDLTEATRALQQARELPRLLARERRDWRVLFAVLAILVGVCGYALILVLA